MCRLASRLFMTSRPFFVDAVVGVRVHRPLHICVRLSMILLAFSCVLQGVDSARGRWLCGTPPCPCSPVTGPCASARFPGLTETYLPTLSFSVPHPPPWAPRPGVLFSIKPPSPGPPPLLFGEYYLVLS